MLNNIGAPGFLMLIVWVVNIAAFWKLLPRSGLSAPWALVAIFPLFAVILLWVIAFKKWPEDHA